MGLFQKIFWRDNIETKSRVERTEIAGMSANMVSLGEVGFSDAIPSRKDDITPDVAANIFNASPYTNAATRILSDAIASTPLIVTMTTRRSGMSKIMNSGSLVQLLSWVNPYMTPYQFKQDIAAWLCINGDAYVAIEPTSDEELAKICPVSLYPMNPSFVSIVPDPDTHARSYIYTINDKKIFLPADKVIHFKNWNPYNHWFGHSSLNSLQYDLQMERFAKKNTANFYANAATVSGTLKIPGEISEEEVRKLKREFNYQYAGARNSYRVMVLTEGMEYEPLKSFGMESNAVPVMGESLKNHAMVLGVPTPILLGDTANLLDAERLMWKKTLIPMQNLIDQTLTKALAPHDYRALVSINFDRSDVEALRTEDLNRTRVDVALVASGIKTVNEIRGDRRLPEFSNAEMVDFANTPRPIWDAKNAEKQAMQQAASKLGVSPSLTLPGIEGGRRDQSGQGEAEFIDQTGER
jgi:HK97 family phage portal protein